MKLHTLRGRVEEGAVKRLVIDDGRFTHAMRVVRFVVAPGDLTQSTADCFGTLSTQYDAPVAWNWQDNRQIAWASVQVPATASLTAPFELIDPDVVVVRDLWIQGVVAGASNTILNYFVELEQIDITQDQAVLALIKERSQDDIR